MIQVRTERLLLRQFELSDSKFIVNLLNEPSFIQNIGDRGVREALDAMEGTDPALRHQVAHLQVVHPGDVPRFARLGVAANMQLRPKWLRLIGGGIE